MWLLSWAIYSLYPSSLLSVLPIALSSPASWGLHWNLSLILITFDNSLRFRCTVSNPASNFLTLTTFWNLGASLRHTMHLVFSFLKDQQHVKNSDKFFWPLEMFSAPTAIAVTTFVRLNSWPSHTSLGAVLIRESLQWLSHLRLCLFKWFLYLSHGSR